MTVQAKSTGVPGTELESQAKLAADGAEPGWLAFIRQYSDPMQIVLLTAGFSASFPSGS